MNGLLRFSAAVDRLNDRIGDWIQWLTLFMVIVGAVNALLRYATRYAGVSLSSNAFIDLQWYMFSLVFLVGGGLGDQPRGPRPRGRDVRTPLDPYAGHHRPAGHRALSGAFQRRDAVRVLAAGAELLGHPRGRRRTLVGSHGTPSRR